MWIVSGQHACQTHTRSLDSFLPCQVRSQGLEDAVSLAFLQVVQEQPANGERRSHVLTLYLCVRPSIASLGSPVFLNADNMLQV